MRRNVGWPRRTDKRKVVPNVPSVKTFHALGSFPPQHATLHDIWDFIANIKLLAEPQMRHIYRCRECELIAGIVTISDSYEDFLSKAEKIREKLQEDLAA